MDKADALAKAKLQADGAGLRRSAVAHFAVFHEGANPKGLFALGEMARQAGDNLIDPVGGNYARLNRCPARGHLIQTADIHFTMGRQRQRARDRCRGHDQ